MHSVDVMHAMTQPTGDSLRMRTAKVSSFGSGLATITLAGTSVASVPYLASYTPTINDVVFVLQTGNGQLLILGEKAT